MEKREMLITIAGLVGTFFLPWPGGDELRQAGTRRQIEPVQIETCTGAAAGERVAHECDALSVRARARSLMQRT